MCSLNFVLFVACWFSLLILAIRFGSYISCFPFLNVGNFERAARKGSAKYCEGMFVLLYGVLNCFRVLLLIHFGKYADWGLLLGIVQVYVANLRLKEVNTDVLITAYEPVHIK